LLKGTVHPKMKILSYLLITYCLVTLGNPLTCIVFSYTMEVNWALGLFGYPFINISYMFLNLLKVWKKNLRVSQWWHFYVWVNYFFKSLASQLFLQRKVSQMLARSLQISLNTNQYSSKNQIIWAIPLISKF